MFRRAARRAGALEARLACAENNASNTSRGKQLEAARAPTFCHCNPFSHAEIEAP